MVGQATSGPGDLEQPKNRSSCRCASSRAAAAADGPARRPEASSSSLVSSSLWCLYLPARGDEIEVVRADSRAVQEQIGVLQAGLDAAKTELEAAKTQREAAKTQREAAKTQREAAKTQRDVVRGELKDVKLELVAQKDKYTALWDEVSVSGPGAAATPARRSIAPAPGLGLTEDPLSDPGGLAFSAAARSSCRRLGRAGRPRRGARAAHPRPACRPRPG